jgi:hypothetical protein
MIEQIAPPPGNSWVPPVFADLTTQWPAMLGPDVPLDAPRPNLTLTWDESHLGNTAAAKLSRSTQKNKHARYHGYTLKSGGAPLEVPTSDSDFGHDDPADSGPGFSRMKVLFEWVLHKVTRALLDLDTARAAGNGTAYATARDTYLKLLSDLNGLPGGTGTGALGYSVAKWVYVNPTIRAGKIEGATIVLQWNPHSSSSIIHP